MNLLSYLPEVAAVLAILHSASLFYKDERFRAAGRLLGGLCLAAVGGCFLAPSVVPVWVIVVFIGSGLVGIGSGLNKARNAIRDS